MISAQNLRTLTNPNMTAERGLRWFFQLSAREKILVIVAAAVIFFIVTSSTLTAVTDYVELTNAKAAQRESAFSQLALLISRFKGLDQRLGRLKESFRKSQMTFEQVTNDLDRIVRESIGSSNYDLKKSGTPEKLGDDFEKQDFTLNVRSMSLPQLVQLLYELEQGTSPLFLGKVDLARGYQDNEFRATLDIATVAANTK